MIAVALATAACTRSAVSEQQRPPNIFLIVLDTLRADRLGAYGSKKQLTPFLDKLASKATVFSRAYAVSSWTCPSVASLFTSRYPSQHHVIEFESVLSEEEVTIAEKLAPLGYRSAGFSANFRVAEELGYAQGFDHWQIHLDASANEPKVRGEALRKASLNWLDRITTEAPEAPLLLYLQYMEPHTPYLPPAEYRARLGIEASDSLIEEVNHRLVSLPFKKLTEADGTLLQRLYDGEVAALDTELKLLFDALQQRRLLDNAIVIVTSDHGEEFGEHGAFLHGSTLYEPSVRIPLIVQRSGLNAQRVTDAKAGLLDIAPTLLDLLGLPAEPRFEGRSLAGILDRGNAPALSRSSDSAAGVREEGAEIILELLRDKHPNTVIGLVFNSTKLLIGPRAKRQLYDLASDPDELRDQFEARRARADYLEALLNARRAEFANRASFVRHTVPIDHSTKERLRALGYGVPSDPVGGTP